MKSNLQTYIKKEMEEIRAKIDKVHEPTEKARLLNLYVDLLERLDVKNIGS